MSTQFAIPDLIDRPTSQIKLRDYQNECVEAILDYIAEHPKGKPAIQIPTGGGKTIIMAEVARRIGYPVLLLAHRDELLDQAAEKFRMVDPGASIGKVKAEVNQPWCEVVTASVQTLCRDNRLNAMPKHFKLIMVDEAHHAVADSYQKIIRHFHGTPVLGVSATLERGNGDGLEGVFDELVFQKDMLWMIGKDYLTDIRSLQIQLKDFNFSRVRMGVGRRDFADGALGDALHDAGAPQYALKAYLEHAADRKTICFTPTVALAEEFAEVFTEGGVPSAFVCGETPRAERHRIYRDLREGRIRVVANAMVLTEGFDEPSVDCIMVARPTLSRPLFIQMVGRGLRPFPGKDDCLVLDMVGNTDRVRLVTIPNLFGVREEMMREGGVTLTRAIAELEAEQTALDVDREIEAIAVDLFTQRKFVWVTARGKDGNSRYVLSAGDGFVTLTVIDAEHELYAVTHDRRHGDNEQVATGLSLEYAQGVAEDYVRRLGAEILNNKEASWRRKPASPKQIAALRKWKIVVEDDGTFQGEPLTSGAASDLLTETIARKKAA